MSEDNNEFQCICGGNYRGKYCHIQINHSANTTATIETTEIVETTTIPQTSVILNTIRLTESTTVIAANTTPEITTTAATCTYQTCQLGNCLPNGTCHCRAPATGELCERIDECLILKCVNVSFFLILLKILKNYSINIF